MNPSTERGSTEKTDDAEERRNHLRGLRLLKARSVSFIYRRMLKLIIANTTKLSTTHFHVIGTGGTSLASTRTPLFK